MPTQREAITWPTDSDPVFVRFVEAYLWPGVTKTMMVGIPKAGIVRPSLISKEALLRIARVNDSKAERLLSSWIAASGLYDLAQLLVPAEVSLFTASAIIDELGEAAATVLESDPWRIVGIRGLQVTQADSMARHVMGDFERDDPRRARALVTEVLRADAREGHTVVAVADIEDQLRAWGIRATDHAIEMCIDDELAQRCAHDGQPALQLARLARAERSIAKDVHRLITTAAQWGTQRSLDKATTGLDEAQKSAVEQALVGGVSILTGGPGTGKSRTVSALVDLAQKHSRPIALAAPTGRAAKRLSELAGIEAMTVHRLLGAQGKGGGFMHGRDNPLEIEVLVVDEASMLDAELAAALLRSCEDGTHVLIVGDDAQLPSIGPGRVLADLIAADVVPVTELTTLYRHAEGGQIARLAAAVRGGELPPLNPDDSHEVVVVATASSAQAAHRTVQLVTDSIPRVFGCASAEIQVVTPVHRGPAGTRELNIALKRQLNPGPGAVSGFDIGDRVVATANYLDATPVGYANGEVGTIEATNGKELVVRFGSGIAHIKGKALRDLLHGWAITVHRAQGSEWQAVIVVLPPESGRLMSRALVYTALTRAQRHLSIVRSPGPALMYAVAQRALKPRRSTLTQRLAVDSLRIS